MSLEVNNTDWLTSLTATTMDSYSPGMEDNLYDDNIVLDIINKKSKVTYIDEGKNLAVNLMVSGNTTTKAFKGFDTVEFRPDQGFINAYIDHAYYITTMVMAYTEMNENAGKAQIVDLVTAKIQQAEASQQDRLSEDLWVASRADSGNAINPFTAMIEASVTPGIYMGVTNTKWRNKYKGIAKSQLKDGLGKLWRQLKDGSTKPDIIVTSDLGEELYEALLADKDATDVGIRYGNNDKGDIAYASFFFKGAPLIVDKHVLDYSGDTLPAYWMLTSKHLGFNYKFGKVGKWEDASNTVGYTNKLITHAQLITNNRRRQGLLKVTSNS